jgi:hypothetical protein
MKEGEKKTRRKRRRLDRRARKGGEVTTRFEHLPIGGVGSKGRRSLRSKLFRFEV